MGRWLALDLRRIPLSGGLFGVDVNLCLNFIPGVGVATLRGTVPIAVGSGGGGGWPLKGGRLEDRVGGLGMATGVVFSGALHWLVVGPACLLSVCGGCGWRLLWYAVSITCCGAQGKEGGGAVVHS